ncbi:MAG: thioredoxin domain-containing protein [Longimicrobiales bacterium]|nr:thioredoxin domain-containing protein [Longimicrobiales bacterium]
MSLNKRTILGLATALLVAACGGDERSDAPGSSTESLTRDLLSQPAGDGQSTPLAVDPSLAQEGARVPVSALGFDRGSVEAPVKVLELSDYGCGYCRKFHMESFPTILSDYIEAGMVEWKFVPFVTGMFDNSLAVTEAAECTYVQDEAAFESLNTRLWEDQSAWKRSDEPMQVVREWVSGLGVDMDAFEACVTNDERLSRVASSTTLASQLGVRGTPTFIVLGYPPLQGALPLEVFEQVLTAVHAEAMRNAEESGDSDPGDATDEGSPGA